MVWTGRVLGILAVLFLLFDGTIKLMNIVPVRESFSRLGYDPGVAPGMGMLELACVVIYLIPRTAILGAVLLTGYLGGAIATHLRVGDPLVSHTLFPLYVGVLLWGGVYLRNPRLRRLLSLQGGTASCEPRDIR